MFIFLFLNKPEVSGGTNEVIRKDTSGIKPQASRRSRALGTRTLEKLRWGLFPLFTERRSLDLLFCPCCCYWRLSWIPIPLTQSERFSEPPFQPSCHHTAVRAVPTGSEKWLWPHRRCDREIRPQPGESDVGWGRADGEAGIEGGRRVAKAPPWTLASWVLGQWAHLLAPWEPG